MSVYRELLEAALAPSMALLKHAMHWEGTSSIFVCGETSGTMRAGRDEQIGYYRSEGVGWPRDGFPAGVKDLVLDNSDPEKGLGEGKKGKRESEGALSFHRAGSFRQSSI